MEETANMTGKTGIGLDVLTWFPPRWCGRNYDISFQYSRLRLTNREWFRGKDHMGSHIPIRQLRRSSVNARPRGATLRGLVVSAVFTNTWATSPSLCRFSVSKRSPGIRVQPWGLHPLSRDISSGFSDSLFFPSALFNSPVASERTVSTFGNVLRYPLEAAVRPESVVDAAGIALCTGTRRPTDDRTGRLATRSGASAQAPSIQAAEGCA